MRLEHESDVPVPECGKFLVIQRTQLPSKEGYRTGGWLVQTSRNIQQGTFSRTTLSGNGNRRTAVQHKIQIFQDNQLRLS